MSLGAGGGEWSLPAGDWLSPEESPLDAQVCNSIFADLQRADRPQCLAEAFAEMPAASSGRTGSTSSSRAGSRASAGGEQPAPSQAMAAPHAARPQLLERSRLPIAGSGGMAFRRSQPASVSPASPASVVAGAIASGWSPPKAKASTALLAKTQADGSMAADHVLVASMASRLAQVEKLNQQQAERCAKQSQELDVLHAEIARLRRVGCSTSGRGDNEERLRAERDAYRRQAEEMTQFLADYGLTWVGDGPDDQDEEDQTESDGGEGEGETGAVESEDRQGGEQDGRARSGSVAEKLGRPPVPEGVALDIKVMEARVQSLNAMVEKESAHIVRSRVGGMTHARLVADDAQTLPLSFFGDGVKLGSHAFMAYELAPAQQLIRDILDGYFPFALKDHHPDGVAMKVIDRTSYVFSAWLQSHAQIDPDLTDSGSRLVPAGVHALRRLGSGAEFLSRLPEKVVRDGRICEIRGPVAQQLGISTPGSSSAQDVLASGGDPSSQEVSMLREDRDDLAPTARLQVKMGGGERVVLHMEASHSIGELEDAVFRWRASCGLPDFVGGQRLQLRTAFPRKVHHDRSQTLEEAGLVPSAALFVGVVEASDA